MTDSIAYGYVSSYMGERNGFIDIWAITRYLIAFICIAGFEKIYENFKLTRKNIVKLCFAAICMIIVVLCGYYMSTLELFNHRFIVVNFALLLSGIIGLHFIRLSLIGNTVKEKEHINTNIPNEMEQIQSMLFGNKEEEKRMMKSGLWLGISMLLILVFYFVIPFVISNTKIDLVELLVWGGVSFFAFIFTNYRKFKMSISMKISDYILETVFLGMGTIVMYYFDGFVYRDMACLNILAAMFVSVMVIPFVVTSRKISLNYYKKMQEKGSNT